MPESRINRKTAIAATALSLAAAWAANVISRQARCYGGDAAQRTLSALANAGEALSNPLPSLDARDLLAGLVAGAAVALLIALKLSGAKKRRDGREHGSARWAGAADIRGFSAKSPDDNIMLSATEGIAIDDDGIPFGKRRNKNVIVVGSSGSGKTRCYVQPNLMNASMRASYVVTDPKGTLLPQVGRLLESRGHRVLRFSLTDMGGSLRYNPLAYVRSESDILKLVNALIANTRGEGESAGEDFWVKSERLYLSALMGYVCEIAPDDERNLCTVIDLVDASAASEEDEGFEGPVDLMFAELAAEDPGSFAVRQYSKYRLAAGKTAKGILISVGARLAPFDVAELRELLSYDELSLDRIGEERSALFIEVSDSDPTFDFVAAIMYAQLFNTLTDRADSAFGGELPLHVHFLLDEFANIGRIPHFERLIATIRSRNMSASIVLQSLSQLKSVYRDGAEVIVGNCDSMVFLGGREPSTLKDMSEALGRETIDVLSTSMTRGTTEGSGASWSRTGRELMTRDELAVMPNGKCIVQIRGLRPFYSEKASIEGHRRFPLTAQADPGNRWRAPAAPSPPGPNDALELFEFDACPE